MTTEKSATSAPPPMRMPSFAKSFPYTAAGVGLAALENKFIAPDLPDPLKRVNYGIGGITGYLLTSPDPKVRFAALAAVPTKQLGLFAIAAGDKLRQQQQSLVDANLGIARVNKSTAELEHGNAAATGRRALMFLLPALLAGGALGYLGYDKWRRGKDRIPRYRTTRERGTSRSGQKIRIDVPATALPPEFYKGLMTADDSPRSHTRFMQLEDGEPRMKMSSEAKAVLVKVAGTDEQFSWPKLVGSIAAEATGVPSLYHAGRDIGRGGSAYSEYQPGEALRYGAGAVGNSALALLALRNGVLPVAGKLMGQNFVRQSPTLAKHVYPWSHADAIRARTSPAQTPVSGGTWASPFGAKAVSLTPEMRRARRAAINWIDPSKATQSPMRRLLNMKGRVNPAMLSTFTPRVTGAPTTVVGHLMNAAGYGKSKLWNAAYRSRKLMTRHPLLTLLALGLPLAGMGSQRDDAQEAEARKSLAGWVPHWQKNQGPLGMPVSAQMSGIMQAITGMNNRQSMRDQMLGASWDPWASMRTHY